MLQIASPLGAASRRRPFAVLTAALWLSFVAAASATPVIWQVDTNNSLIRLAIPDQVVPVTNVGNVTIRFRDASSTSAWTTNGGSRAYLGGQIVTDYEDGVSISFRGGEHNLYALETTALRPNAAAWNTATNGYTNTTTAPAALGARIRGTYILTFDMAFLALRQVTLDLTNGTPGPIPLTGGAFGGGTTRCGIEHALADVDGLELPFDLGQPVPDILSGELLTGLLTNAAGGVITALSAFERKLTYTLNLTNLAIDLDGTVLTGSATGQIVAHATLPPPPVPPTLSVSRLGGSIVLTWSTNATGFALQRATALPATAWLPVTPGPVVVGNQYAVTNTATGPAAYYRLRKP
jgi:hypothetical protein